MLFILAAISKKPAMFILSGMLLQASFKFSFSSIFFFFGVCLILDVLVQTEQRNPRVQTFQEALVSFFEILKTNKL